MAVTMAKSPSTATTSQLLLINIINNSMLSERWASPKNFALLELAQTEILIANVEVN